MIKKVVLILVNHEVVIYNFRLELIEKLLQEGYEVHVSSPPGEKINRLVQMGCIHHPVQLERRSKSFIKDFILMKSYYDLIKTLTPSIVLTFTIKPNIYGGLVSRMTHTPYITNITGLGSGFSEDANPFIKKLITNLYKISLKEASCVFFQNSDNQNVFLNRKIRIKKHKLLPGSGVNTDRYNYLQFPQNDATHVFYFGRLMDEKGINELLEAAVQIKSQYKNVSFHLVGFSEDTELTERIIKLQDKDVVFYHGYHNDIKDFLKMSSVVVQPSHHEGMSNVLLESSSSGRPVIASNIPGCKEIVDDGVTGFLFDVKSSASLVESIQKFLSKSYEEKKVMGMNARKKMIDEFSRSLITGEYVKEINLAVETRKRDNNELI